MQDRFTGQLSQRRPAIFIGIHILASAAPVPGLPRRAGNALLPGCAPRSPGLRVAKLTAHRAGL
ncbi:hypothetical protein NKH18_32390 [Streptomyces sp. M10(2022)]